MKSPALSRRTFLGTGAGSVIALAAWPGSGRAEGAAGFSAQDEQAVRKYYVLWETRDWTPFDALLADNFTFTSAAGDDHISKREFKERCWDTQIDHIKRFDLLHVFGNENTAFVMYDCHTKNDKSFRNVEFVTVGNGRVESIECYFGGNDTFASAVSSGHR